MILLNSYLRFANFALHLLHFTRVSVVLRPINMKVHMIVQNTTEHACFSFRKYLPAHFSAQRRYKNDHCGGTNLVYRGSLVSHRMATLLYQ
jgi:hypothetical protein